MSARRHLTVKRDGLNVFLLNTIPRVESLGGAPAWMSADAARGLARELLDVADSIEPRRLIQPHETMPTGHFFLPNPSGEDARPRLIDHRADEVAVVLGANGIGRRSILLTADATGVTLRGQMRTSIAVVPVDARTVTVKTLGP